MAKDNLQSTSAIYRLCNKLEFSGYSDMIYHLSSNTHNNAPAQNTKLFTSILFNY